MAFSSNWGVGCDPIAVASKFYASTKDNARHLGKRAYLKAVAAAVCAATANALSATAVLHDEALDTCKNIILAARHVEALASRDFAAEDGEDEPGRRSNTACTSELSPIAKLERTVTALRQRHEQQKRQNYSTRATQARAEPAATSAASTSTTPTAAPSSTFPLPPAVLPALLSRLDARTAAALSSYCKSLRAAYLDQSFHQLPDLFSLFIQTASGAANHQNSFSDGSIEDGFVLKHPLDGSPACGADLISSQGARQGLRVLQQALRLWPSCAEGATLPKPPDHTR